MIELPGPVGTLLVVALVVTAVLVAGFRLGMLVAPRLSRWADRDDNEEPGDAADTHP